MRSVNVESVWSEEATRKEKFDNLLVVAISPNYNLRCGYEHRVVSDLRTGGTTASTSCAHLDPDDPLTVESIEPIVAEIGAEAVLVTELIGREDQLVEGGSSETRGEAYYKPVGYGYAYRRPYYGGYGRYGLPVTFVEFTAEQSAFEMQTSVAVATNVFETQDATLVYSVQVTAKKQVTTEQILYELALNLVDQLRSDGLVAKRKKR